MYRHVYTYLLATRGALWALLDFALRISWESNPSTSKNTPINSADTLSGGRQNKFPLSPKSF